MTGQIAIPVSVIKAAAAELGMIEPSEDVNFIAAIDDYFATLRDGNYSPLSGEHNNASNVNELQMIARKHGVCPERLMRYLTDTGIYDKFEKLSLGESISEGNITNKIKSVFNPSGYKSFKAKALEDVITIMRRGENLSYAVRAMSETYGIPFKELMKGVEELSSGDDGYGKQVENKVMAKRKKAKNVKKDYSGKAAGSNPVQKNLRKVSSGGRHADKKNDYKRKEKHKGGVEEGYRVLPPIDRERYRNLEHEGLEGPYSNKHGKVYYYDRNEGKYYDPDSDFYMEVDQVMEGKVSGIISESIQSLTSILEGKKVSAHEAKLMMMLDNINADYLHDESGIMLEMPLYAQVVEKFPEFEGFVREAGVCESTMAGNIAGSAQPIGDIQKRRGLAEEEPEEDEGQELDESVPNPMRNFKMLKQSGGRLTVDDGFDEKSELVYDRETRRWGLPNGDTFETKELLPLLNISDGVVYLNY